MEILELIHGYSRFFNLCPKDTYVLWVGRSATHHLALKMLDMDRMMSKEEIANGPAAAVQEFTQQIMRGEMTLFGYKVKLSQDEPGFRFERAVPQ